MKRSQVQVLVPPRTPFGALAQLVERLLCKQEVRSSILLGSTPVSARACPPVTTVPARPGASRTGPIFPAMPLAAVTIVVTLGLSGQASHTTHPPVAPSQQRADRRVVVRFLASHPVPNGGSSSQWSGFLNAVPWSVLYGQWGCTLGRVDVTVGSASSMHTFGTISNCGGDESLVGRAGSFAVAPIRHSAPFGRTSPARAGEVVPIGALCAAGSGGLSADEGLLAHPAVDLAVAGCPARLRGQVRDPDLPVAAGSGRADRR